MTASEEIVEIDNQSDEIDNQTDEIGNQTDEIEATEDDSEGQYKTSIVHTTPGGHMYWTPIIPDDLKPRKSMVFKTLEDGEHFYERYARLAGFEVRKSTLKRGVQGEVKLRIVVCSKEGTPGRSKTDDLDGKQQQQRMVPSCKTDCKAHIGFHLDKVGSYEVYRFGEQHNHSLVPSAEAHLMRSVRKLTFEQQSMIHRASNTNIGAVNTYKLCKELSGGYEYVGATRTDFKNFKRDINCYIGSSDAQMVVNKYSTKAKNETNFHFQHSTKTGGALDTIFWADEVAIANYNAFGDVMSFDATYRTNMYDLLHAAGTNILIRY